MHACMHAPSHACQNASAYMSMNVCLQTDLKSLTPSVQVSRFPLPSSQNVHPAQRMTFTPDGSRLVVGTSAGTLEIWDISGDKGSLLQTLPLNSEGKTGYVVFTQSFNPLCSIWCMRQRHRTAIWFCLLLLLGPPRGSVQCSLEPIFFDGTLHHPAQMCWCQEICSWVGDLLSALVPCPHESSYWSASFLLPADSVSLLTFLQIGVASPMPDPLPF